MSAPEVNYPVSLYILEVKYPVDKMWAGRRSKSRLKQEKVAW